MEDIAIRDLKSVSSTIINKVMYLYAIIVFGNMSEIEEKIIPLIKNVVGTGSEGIMMDVVQDLAKDEIKKYLRQKIEEKPELKNEIKKNIEELLEAKVKEYLATIKLTKSMAKLGINVVPEHLRAELSKELTGIFESEISQIIEKTI